MKIGLALGSGAARGWAHIGIIQALQEQGIKIEVVAGCSIGAYVGAAFCNNKLKELTEWALQLNEWQVLGLMGVGLKRGGMVSGAKVFDILAEQFSAKEFSDLPIPFGTVATDLYSGREMAFSEGDITLAVKASCAIPGLFPPVQHNDRWLVDGAVVNPVPVNLCHQLGADFIIAVNLGADHRPQIASCPEQEHEQNQQKTNDFFAKSQDIMKQWFGNKADKNTPSVFGVMSSSMDILQARITRSRLASEPPDLIIEPHLRQFGIMEFYRAEELIEEGRQSVERILGQLNYLLDKH